MARAPLRAGCPLGRWARGGVGALGCTRLSPAARRYSLEAQALEHSCRCCQELRAAPRNVTLRCPDGSRRAFSYTQVEECGCVGQHCHARGDLGPEEPAPLQRRDPEHERWSRGAPALPLPEGHLPAH